MVGLPLLHEILGNMGIAIVWFLGCDIINFEMKLIFLIRAFLLHAQKFTTKV